MSTTTTVDAVEGRAAARASGDGDLSGRATMNTLAQLAPPLLRVVLGIVLVALLSRELGREGLGQYALIFAYVALFNVVFNDWGISTIVLREISQHPGDRRALLHAAASLQMFISAGSYACMAAGLFLLDYPEPVRYGAMIYGLSLFAGPINLLALPFQADLRLHELLAPSIAQTLLMFGLSVAVVAAGGSVLWLAVASLAAIAVQYTWTALLCRHWISPNGAVDGTARRALWRRLTREAWPVGAASTLKVGWQQFPVLVLGAFSVGATGLFHAANRVPQQLIVLPMALNTTMFPLLARSWAFDRVLFARQLDRLVGGSLFFVVPAAVFGIATADPFMRLLLGPEFAGATTPYTLLLATAALLFPIIFLAEALNAASCQRLNLTLLAVLTPVLMVAVITGARLEGATGVAAALVGGYAAYLVALLAAAIWRFGHAAPVSATGTSVAAALAGTMTVLVTADAGAVLSGTAGAVTAMATFAAARPDLATLTRRALGALPAFTTQPIAQEAPHGQRTS